ncbi:unnamed protein product, partial [Ceratitis capitata]
GDNNNNNNDNKTQPLLHVKCAWIFHIQLVFVYLCKCALVRIYVEHRRQRVNACQCNCGDVKRQNVAARAPSSTQPSTTPKP